MRPSPPKNSVRESIFPPESLNGQTSGRLDSSFEVTAEGAANVNIRLWVPRGRAGMEPSLSFQYDSRRGNGLLGVGWSLAFASAITRCRQDHFHDHRSAPVGFDARDPFCLDGQRLVLVSGVHGQNGAEYRTHLDTFSRIVLNEPDAFGPTSFTVYQKNGRILSYGPDDQSRVVGQRVEIEVPASGEGLVPGWVLNNDLKGITPNFSGSVRYSWLLSEVRDRAGNRMSLSWSEFPFNAEGSAGRFLSEKVLQEITYCSSVQPNDPRPPGRRVTFIYEQRPDVSDEFISGLHLWHPARLSRVEMYGPDPVQPSILRVYSLAYRIGSTGRSLIESVTESDDVPPSGVSRPPHRFEYEDNLPDFDDIDTGISDIRTSPGGRSRLPGRICIMDIDGDGRDDILYASASRVGYYCFRLARTGPDGRPCLSREYPTDIQLSTRPERPYPIDFDLDGRADLLTFDDQYNIGRGYGSRYLFSSPQIDPDTNDLVLMPVQELDVDLAEVADLNGDGRPDLLVSYNDNGTPTHAWSFSLNATGSFGPGTVVPQVTLDDHRFVDIDGDGALEVLTCLGQLGGPVIYGEWFSALRLGRDTAFPPVVTSLRANQRYLFLDLNGDGLLDVVWEGASNNAIPSVIMNSGNGFFPPIGQPFANYAYYGDPVKRAIDYNLDGRKEVVVRYNTAFVPDSVIVVNWNGETFDPPYLCQSGVFAMSPKRPSYLKSWTSMETAWTT